MSFKKRSREPEENSDEHEHEQERENEYCRNVGNNVYFYGDVNPKNILKLNTLLNQSM